MTTQALLATTALRRRVEECSNELASIKQVTQVLPQLLKNAQGKNGWGTGQTGQRRGGRKSILMEGGAINVGRRPSVMTRMTGIFIRNGEETPNSSNP